MRPSKKPNRALRIRVEPQIWRNTMSASATSPTVVLVHGAFADASSWNGVIAELEGAGIDVVAPANPLRGIEPDADFLTGFVDSLDRPVILVGHSYGGAVISQTGTDAQRAVGLVFVAAFAPDTDEALSDINARYPNVALGATLLPFTYADAQGDEHTDLAIDRSKFRDAFCADLPEARAGLAAATQRSIAASAFTDTLRGVPAWHTHPSWAVVATADRAIHPDAERDMANRASAQVVELDGSHAVAVS
jgi:pimeloyl-ACP methyl ester carboxylesterase